MPRLSSAELLEAKRLKAAQREAEERRELEEAELKRRAEESRRSALARHSNQFAQVNSFVDGLYFEVDKVSRKKPALVITSLILDRVNYGVRSVRNLLAGADEDLCRDIVEFFPAGDMLECRDVVLILRRLKSALGGFEHRHQYEWAALDRPQGGGSQDGWTA